MVLPLLLALKLIQSRYWDGYASLGGGESNPNLKMHIGEHEDELIENFSCNRQENRNYSTIRILDVGRGEGDNDLAFLQIVNKSTQDKGKHLISECVIEPLRQANVGNISQ